MLQDTIRHVGQLGQAQGMPKSITFADRYSFELIDNDNNVDDDHDSD